MKNTFKKLISVILSVLMVVTMLPAFAMTASADEDTDLLARYLTDGTGDLTTSGTVTWDSTAYDGKIGAAKFSNSGYLYSDDFSSVISGVTDNTITISFMGYVNGGGNDYERFYDINNRGHNLGSVTWDSRAGAAYVEYYAQKGIIEGTIDRGANGAIQSTGDTCIDNTWAQYTTVISGSTMTQYVNGEQKAQITITSGDTLIDTFKTSGYLLIGGECWPDTYTLQGMVRDFRIYSGAKDASTLYTDYATDIANTDAAADAAPEDCAADHLVARLFTTSDPTYNAATQTTGALETVSGTVTAADDGTTTFSSAYMQFTDTEKSKNLLKNVAGNGGITFTFTYSSDASSNHRALFSAGNNAFATDGSGAKDMFYINATSNWMTGDTSKYLFTGGANTSDQYINCYPDYSFSASTSYDCAVVITRSEVKYYINGTLYSTKTHDDSYNTDNLTTVIDSLSSYSKNYMYIGRSYWNDDAFSGKIKNFCIYDTALDESEFYSNNNKYLFSYFTGNNGALATTSNSQALHYAVSSDDGTSIEALNDNKPVLAQNLGTQNMRDPYMFKGQDGKYYIIATDMDVNQTGTGSWMWSNVSQSFVLWSSTDMVNWKNETIIDVAQITGGDISCAWAPEVYYDTNAGKYMVYFAIAGDDYTATRMYYMYTDDLLDQSKYSQPVPIMTYNDGYAKGTIDGDIIYEDGKYYMFYKDEGLGTISIVASDTVNSYDHSKAVKLSTTKASALEGCEVYRDYYGDYILFADNYNNNGTFCVYNLGNNLSTFIAKASENAIDIDSYYLESTSSSYSSVSPRHGSFISVSNDQYNTIKNATYTYNQVNKNKTLNIDSELLAQYLVNDTTTDEIGDYDLTSVKGDGGNAVTWAADEVSSGIGAAVFTDDEYLQTDQIKNILNKSGSKEFTISLYAKRSGSAGTVDRLFELNEHGGDYCGYSYGDISSKYLSVWSQSQFESCFGSTVGLKRRGADRAVNGYWGTYILTYKLDGDVETVTLYRNGIKWASQTTNISSTGSMYDKIFNYLTIGMATFTGEGFEGSMRDFRIYGRAIDSVEAYKLSNTYSAAYNSNFGADSKVWVKANASTATVKTGTATGKYNGSTATNGYYNLLYCSSSVKSTSEISCGNLRSYMYIPSAVVMLYDGSKTNPSFPVGVGAYASSSSNRSIQYLYPSVEGTTNAQKNSASSVFKLSHAWYGEPTSNTWTESSSTKAGYYIDDTSTGSWTAQKSVTKYLTSQQEYIATPSAYLTNYPTQTYSSYNDQRGTYWATNVSANINVINYKPIADEYANVKAMAEEVIANEKSGKDYCTDELDAFYDAAYSVLSFDPNTYFSEANDDGVSTCATNCANAIKDIVDNDLTTALTEPGVHTWDSGVVTKAPTCTATGVKTYTCTKCGDTKTESLDALGHNYNYTVSKNNGVYTWSGVCSYNSEHTTSKEIDANAYNDAVTKANADIAKTKMYSASSIAKLQQVLTDNTFDTSATSAETQETLNAKTSAITTADQLASTGGVLEYATYSITFNIVNQDGTAVEEAQTFANQEYGSQVTFTVNSDKYAVTKWSRTLSDDSDEKVDSNNNVLTYVVDGKYTNYYAYVKDYTSDTSTDTVAVVMNNNANKASDVNYISTSNAVITNITTTEDSSKTASITIGTATLTAPSYSFYKVTGFTVNGVTASVNATVDTSDKIVVKPIYTPVSNYDIVLASGVRTSSGKTASVSAGWNDKITVTADNADANTQWLIDGVVVGYGATYTFRVTQACTVSYKASQTATATVSVNYLSYNLYKSKTITAVGSYSLPSGCTFVETGVIMKTSTQSMDDVTNATYSTSNSTGVFKASNIVRDTNQFTINVYSAKGYSDTGLNIGAVAYLIYKDASGNEQTVYSPANSGNATATYQYTA